MEIWITDIRLAELDRRPELLLSLLSEPEREKALRFRRQDDRLRCAAGRLMIRALAAESTGRADVPVQVSAYGKPFFALKGAPHFNLSHSGDLVVLASGDTPLGVDVEERRPIDWHELSPALSAEERQLLESDKNPPRLFYRLWTIREAFSKEEGTGLSLFENETVSMDFVNETIRFHGRTLRFHTWELPGYTLSICAAEPGKIRLRHLTAASWNDILAHSRESGLP